MLLSSARWKYTCNKEKKFARKFTRKEERERERGSTVVKPQVLDRIRICSRTAPTKYLDTLFIDARRIVNVLAIKKEKFRKKVHAKDQTTRIRVSRKRKTSGYYVGY